MAKKAPKEMLHEMSVQELEALLREAQEKSFKLKFQHATNPLTDHTVIRIARRRVARLLTVLHQKEKVADAK